MSERSMYETIMDLPLFKGVSKDQVSLFLEKTSIHFGRYMSGECIVKKGDPVNSIKFVLLGTIKVTHECENERVFITEYCSYPVVLGAERLFGLNPIYHNDVKAFGQVSVMEFSKEKYLHMIKTEQIYLLNFVNYLSLKIQRREEILQQSHSNSLVTYLVNWIKLYTDKKSDRIKVAPANGDMTIFSKIVGSDVSGEMALLAESGIVEITDNSIVILDKTRLFNVVENPQIMDPELEEDPNSEGEAEPEAEES